MDINEPPPLSIVKRVTPDALGRVRELTTEAVHGWWVRRIVPTALVKWAESFVSPPAIELQGARLNVPSYSQERRAIRVIVESRTVQIQLKPSRHAMNPEFELEGAPKELTAATLDGNALLRSNNACDEATLWIKAAIGQSAAKIKLQLKSISSQRKK